MEIQNFGDLSSLQIREMTIVTDLQVPTMFGRIIDTHKSCLLNLFIYYTLMIDDVFENAR